MTHCAPFLIAVTVESEEMPEYWVHTVEELDAQGELAEALATLERAVKTLPTAPSLWIAQGKLLDKAARPDEALQALSKAIELAGADTNAFGPSLKEARLARSALLRQLNRFDEAARENLAAQDIPARDPKAAPNLVDLSCYYNAGLDRAWLNTNKVGNNLATLPHGLQMLAEVAFDIRGVLQLSGIDLLEVNPIYPSEMKGIRMGLKGKRLHFLHAVGWRIADAVQVGTYTLHYADGQQQEIPILYGEQVRDWWCSVDKKPLGADTVVAWNGTNTFQQPFRIFKTTWTNPRPEVEVQSLDFVSTVTKCAPFLLAVTVE